MLLCLQKIIALVETLGSVLSTHMVALNHQGLVPKTLTPSSDFGWHKIPMWKHLYLWNTINKYEDLIINLGELSEKSFYWD